jgi:hypothetical protein
MAALRGGSESSCTPMYTAVVTRPVLGARPFGASLRLFKIVSDDFVAAVRLALPALATFLKQLLSLSNQAHQARKGAGAGAIGLARMACIGDSP